jgi:hypothetical protein
MRSQKPINSSIDDSMTHQSQQAMASMNQSHLNPRSEDKILITGDDVLIEYVERLIGCIKPIGET